jgi:hypothetical protein
MPSASHEFLANHVQRKLIGVFKPHLKLMPYGLWRCTLVGSRQWHAKTPMGALAGWREVNNHWSVVIRKRWKAPHWKPFKPGQAVECGEAGAHELPGGRLMVSHPCPNASEPLSLNTRTRLINLVLAAFGRTP